MNPTIDDAPKAHHSPPTDFESEGIRTRFLFGIVFGTVLIVVLLVAVGFTAATVKSQEIREDVAASVQYPELRDARAQAAEKLNHYAVVDAENGVYRVPIEQAIKLMANEAFQQQQRGENVYSGELPLIQPAN